MQGIEKVLEATIYLTPVVAFVACMALFARTRKIGFVVLGIVQLVYLLPVLARHFVPNPLVSLLLNVVEMGAWVLLVAGFLSSRDRGIPAAAGAVAPLSPAAPRHQCVNCRTPLTPADRFCVKCGQATGA